MAESEPKAWQQRPGEPDESYARFLLYRNLGPGRTLQVAYNAFVSQFKNAQEPDKRNKTQLSIPGHWGEDSARWEWVDRASAWDVHVFSTHGERLAVLWVGILTAAAEKCAQKLADPKCKPRDFMQCVAVVDKLAAFLSPDAVKSLQPAAGPAGPKPKPDRAGVK